MLLTGLVQTTAPAGVLVRASRRGLGILDCRSILRRSILRRSVPVVSHDLKWIGFPNRSLACSSVAAWLHRMVLRHLLGWKSVDVRGSGRELGGAAMGGED